MDEAEYCNRVYHDGDTVTILRLIHIMGGDEDRDPPGSRFIDQLPELAAGDGIDASGRLIQENDLGIMDDRHGEG